MPTGEEDFIIPKYAKGENKGGYVGTSDQKYLVFLGQLISKELFPNRKERCALFTFQRSYDLVHSKSKEGKAFKKLNEDYDFYNREVIKGAYSLEKGTIIPDPIVSEKEGKLVYDGKSIEVKINRANVIDNLIEAGLFKESTFSLDSGDI